MSTMIVTGKQLEEVVRQVNESYAALTKRVAALEAEVEELKAPSSVRAKAESKSKSAA